MPEPTAQRTLVKSPPELWAEVSDAESLAKHLAELGGEEIRITRIEPETSVTWEGEHARGTVQIEPSGWGTTVTLTATPVEPEPEPEPEPQPAAAAEPAASAPPAPEMAPPAIDPAPPAPAPLSADDFLARTGFFARMFGRGRLEKLEAPEPPDEPAPPEPPPIAPVPEPEPESEPLEPDPLPEPTPLRPDPGPPAAARAEAIAPQRVEALLSDVLDSLGSAHHRPFSRQ
jgi:hypothetical protein